MIVTLVLVLFSVRWTGLPVCSLDIWHAVLQPSPTRWHMTNHMYAYY